jgi:hypothetical protein
LEEGLKKVLEGARVWRYVGKLRPERGYREADIRLVVPLRGLVRVVPQRAVMVVFPVLDRRFVEGCLLQGGVRPT